jgi:hypothetical protein
MPEETDLKATYLLKHREILGLLLIVYVSIDNNQECHGIII